MNLPNKLTLVRIFLVIPLIILLALFTWSVPDYNLVTTQSWQQGFLYGAGAIFIIAMITDAFDGHLARKNNQITIFGKLFDPLADKIIVTTTLIFLAIFRYTSPSIVVLFVIRDLIVDGSRNVAASNNIKVEASIWGKIKTVTQSIAIIILLFFSPLVEKTGQNNLWQLSLLNIPMIIALISSVFSGIQYFSQIVPIINKSK